MNKQPVKMSRLSFNMQHILFHQIKKPKMNTHKKKRRRRKPWVYKSRYGFPRQRRGFNQFAFGTRSVDYTNRPFSRSYKRNGKFYKRSNTTPQYRFPMRGDRPSLSNLLLPNPFPSPVYSFASSQMYDGQRASIGKKVSPYIMPIQINNSADSGYAQVLFHATQPGFIFNVTLEGDIWGTSATRPGHPKTRNRTRSSQSVSQGNRPSKRRAVSGDVPDFFLNTPERLIQSSPDLFNFDTDTNNDPDDTPVKDNYLVPFTFAIVRVKNPTLVDLNTTVPGETTNPNDLTNLMENIRLTKEEARANLSNPMSPASNLTRPPKGIFEHNGLRVDHTQLGDQFYMDRESVIVVGAGTLSDNSYNNGLLLHTVKKSGKIGPLNPGDHIVFVMKIPSLENAEFNINLVATMMFGE